MRTHELAEILNQLASILKNAPNVEIESLPELISKSRDVSAEVGLKTLVNLSKLDKQEWIRIAEKHNFDIKFNQRDSSRDVLGKILRYLATNEQEYVRFEKSLAKTAKSSEPLENMLKLLMSM